MSDGWHEYTLGDICRLEKGTSPTQKTSPGPYPLIVTGAEPLSADSYQFEGEAVCVPMVSSTGHGHASLKRVHYASGRFAVANIVTACVVKDPNLCDVRYLWLYLQQRKDELIVTRMRGTANVSLSQRELATVPVLLPSLAEQHRIVDLVGALDEAIEAAAAYSQSLERAYDSLISRLIFDDPRWPRSPLKDLATERGLIGGPFGSSLVSADYTDAGVPVIRGTNMLAESDFVGGPFAHVSPAKALTLSRNAAIAGDVVFTQRGTLGQVNLIPANGTPSYVISQSQMRLRVNEKAIARFVFHAFRSARMNRHSKTLNSATANPHINLGILGAVEIPVPSVPDQEEITAVLDIAQDGVGTARPVTQSLRALRTEILAACLSGEHEIPASYDQIMTEAAA